MSKHDGEKGDAPRPYSVPMEQFDKNFIFISPDEHSPQGIRASMTRLRQQWQPFARKIKPE